MLNYLAGSLKPRHDNVLVKVLPPPREAQSDVIVEPDRKYRPIDAAWATVVAVPDALESFARSCAKCERPFDRYDDRLAVGDTVLLDSVNAGDVLVLDGEELRLVRLAEVLAVVERREAS